MVTHFYSYLTLELELALLTFCSFFLLHTHLALRSLPSTILIVNISNSTLIDCVIGNKAYPSTVAETQPLMQKSERQMHREKVLIILCRNLKQFDLPSIFIQACSKKSQECREGRGTGPLQLCYSFGSKYDSVHDDMHGFFFCCFVCFYPMKQVAWKTDLDQLKMYYTKGPMSSDFSLRIFSEFFFLPSESPPPTPNSNFNLRI